MRVLIGIDDTDNKESRGTGFRSRKMGGLIEEKELGKVLGISRHQLFVHPDIPYTSQNSSACLLIETADKETLTEFCREFLLEDSADGSDVGLCVCEYDKVDAEVIEWGNKAKKEVLTKAGAVELAEKKGIFLVGLTGTHDGMIGSLAAIGLRKGGNDGRFIWLKGKEIRDLKGVMTISGLKKISGIEKVMTKEESELNDNELIDLGDWIRPVLLNNKVVLIVEARDHEKCKWNSVTKDYIKSISD